MPGQAQSRMNKILIADDHGILRAGLKEILVRELQHLICGEAENAEQVLAQVRTQSWDLLILDITMPGRSGLDIISDLKACGRNFGCASSACIRKTNSLNAH